MQGGRRQHARPPDASLTGFAAHAEPLKACLWGYVKTASGFACHPPASQCRPADFVPESVARVAPVDAVVSPPAAQILFGYPLVREGGVQLSCAELSCVDGTCCCAATLADDGLA